MLRHGGLAMATLDHFILKVNDLEASVAFYAGVLGFASEGTDGPFTVLRVNPEFQIQLAPWGTGPGQESGARGLAPTLYFNDPNKHLLEIRSYPLGGTDDANNSG